MSLRSPLLVPIRDSIATQLLKIVFALYLVLLVTATLFQLMAQFMHTKAEVLQELTMLEATLKPGLDQALWEMNEPQIHSISTGVIQLSNVVGIRISDYSGNVIDQIGQLADSQGNILAVSLDGTSVQEGAASRLFWHEFSLRYTRGGQDFPLGDVVIYSSSSVVFKRIRFGFLLLMTAAVIQIAAFWLLFLWISRTRLSRPLAELTYAAAQLDLDNLENIRIRVKTSGRNELKILEETFNAMIQKLLTARGKLHELNRNLQHHRDELELRVQERTARLSEINTLLTKSEQRLKEAQRIAQLGNWEWNIQANKIFWSEQIYRIFGVDPQEFSVTYEAFVQRVHPEDRDTVQQSVNETLHHGKSYSLDHRIVLPDGSTRTVHEQGEVTFDKGNEPVKMFGTVQDISEQKQAEEALRAGEHQLRLITDNTPAYIAYVGIHDLRYRFVNRNFEIAYARTREQIIGRHIKDIIGEANYQFALDYIDMVRTGQPASYENSFPTELGNRWIQVNYVPDFDEQGAVRAIVVMSHDITEQKHTELLLQQAKEDAEAASRAKSVFLANMSHELRTPLHGILGFARQLAKDRSLTEAQQQHVDVIERSGEHLLTLLNDILDFSSIEADKLTLHPSQFALHGLLSQLAEIFRFNAGQNGLIFVYEAAADLPHFAYGDQGRLRQILLNLLGNAIRFTERGKVIFRVKTVSGEPTSIEDHALNGSSSPQKTERCSLLFEVEDTGIGIAPEHLNSIFQPFQQADPLRLQEGRRGLGLAISQQFVQMMGSHLHVTSTPGVGSTFWFNLELPVLDADEMAISSPKSGRSLEFPPQETLIHALAALPADWLAMLGKGASDVDPEVLSNIIVRIRERDATLADALSQLTEEFEYDTILRLLQESASCVDFGI